MALADLLRALEAQAAERRDAELATAEAEAERIRSEARRHVERRREDVLAQTRHEEETLAQRALSRARAEASTAALAARDRLIERLRSALDARLARAESDPAYRATLASDVRAGLARLPAGRVVVRARPALLGDVRSALKERTDVVVEASPGMGIGFTAEAPDEGVEVDGTLAERLVHAWPRLAVAALRDVGGVAP